MVDVGLSCHFKLQSDTTAASTAIHPIEKLFNSSTFFAKINNRHVLVRSVVKLKENQTQHAELWKKEICTGAHGGVA
jgi:hypothetical protein